MRKNQVATILSILLSFNMAADASLKFGIKTNKAASSASSSSYRGGGPISSESSLDSMGDVGLPSGSGFGGFPSPGGMGNHGSGTSQPGDSKRWGGPSDERVNVDYKGVSVDNICEESNEQKNFDQVVFKSAGKVTCDVAINADFSKQLKSVFMSCIGEVMGKGKRVEIEHMGICSNRTARGSSRWSQHKACRAMDISKITVDGKVLDMNIRRNSGKQYDELRRCWTREGQKIAKERGYSSGECVVGSIGHNHSHSPKNSLHHDHLHLSFNCPRLKGFVKY